MKSFVTAAMALGCVFLLTATAEARFGRTGYSRLHVGPGYAVPHTAAAVSVVPRSEASGEETVTRSFSFEPGQAPAATAPRPVERRARLWRRIPPHRRLHPGHFWE
ncbi:MAG: hypothetical protein D6725_07020 [Planctomycetota bacterium]|nr:MAG: hypothetical protein D6725_07020 [Planctomycetota bacterium]